MIVSTYVLNSTPHWQIYDCLNSSQTLHAIDWWSRQTLHPTVKWLSQLTSTSAPPWKMIVSTHVELCTPMTNNCLNSRQLCTPQMINIVLNWVCICTPIDKWRSQLTSKSAQSWQIIFSTQYVIRHTTHKWLYQLSTHRRQMIDSSLGRDWQSIL